MDMEFGKFSACLQLGMTQGMKRRLSATCICVHPWSHWHRKPSTVPCSTVQFPFPQDTILQIESARRDRAKPSGNTITTQLDGAPQKHVDHRGLLVTGESMGARGEKKSSAAATRAATARSATSAARRVPDASVILVSWFLGPFRSFGPGGSSVLFGVRPPLLPCAGGCVFKAGAVAAVGWQAGRSFYGEAASRD
jgi:hypothetical protein